MAEAPQAIGHEQDDGDEYSAGDPECKGDRLVDVGPVRRDRRPPPRAQKMKYDRADGQHNQSERDLHIDTEDVPPVKPGSA